MTIGIDRRTVENYPAESRLLILEGQVETDRATVQVRGYRRPNDEFDQLIAWPELTLIRSLGPAKYTATPGATRFAGLGDVFLVPAGIPLRYRSRGGPYRHLACRLDRNVFERLTRLTISAITGCSTRAVTSDLADRCRAGQTRRRNIEAVFRLRNSHVTRNCCPAPP